MRLITLLLVSMIAVFAHAQSTKSFAKGTRITLDNGTDKNIEDITEQDELLVYNPVEVKIKMCKVAKVHKSTSTSLLKVTFANDMELMLTPEQPLLSKKGGVSYNPIQKEDAKKVDKYKVNTYILSLNNYLKIEMVPIIAIDEIKEITETYTLELADSQASFIANNMFAGQD